MARAYAAPVVVVFSTPAAGHGAGAVAPVHRFFMVPVYITLSKDRPSAAPGSIGLARHVAMKITLVALFVIAALGGGYFAWTEFFAGEYGGGASSFFGGDDKLRYVEIESLTAPFIRDGEFVQYVLLDVSLELTDEPNATKVRRLPRGAPPAGAHSARQSEADQPRAGQGAAPGRRRSGARSGRGSRRPGAARPLTSARPRRADALVA